MAPSGKQTEWQRLKAAAEKGGRRAQKKFEDLKARKAKYHRAYNARKRKAASKASHAKERRKTHRIASTSKPAHSDAGAHGTTVASVSTIPSRATSEQAPPKAATRSALVRYTIMGATSSSDGEDQQDIGSEEEAVANEGSFEPREADEGAHIKTEPAAAEDTSVSLRVRSNVEEENGLRLRKRQLECLRREMALEREEIEVDLKLHRLCRGRQHG